MRRQMIVGVHGLGYVGLTAAVHFARAGHQVIGYDPDAAAVAALNAGTPKAGEFLRYIGDKQSQAMDRLHATTTFEETLEADAHVVAVPTERRGKPDDSIVRDVLERLWGRSKRGAVLIVESTLIPGTIDRVLGDCLSHGHGRRVGEDVFLAVCPRRDWFADEDKNLGTLPRVVGGVTDACTEKAVEVLRTVSMTILPTDYRTAEVTKSLENALLHVPLMFVEQLACAMPNVNVAEAVRLAGTHWRLMPLYLNAGTGGRCVPLGTQYLELAASTQPYPFSEELTIARDANKFEERIRFLVAQAMMRWGRGRGRALILGIAYRPEFKDAGLSPGLGVAKRLALTFGPPSGETSVVVHVNDPMWTHAELEGIVTADSAAGGLLHVVGMEQLLDNDYDVILLATPHRAYDALRPSWTKAPGATYRVPWRKGQTFIDAQGAWAAERPWFADLGVKYVQIGDPGWMGPLMEPEAG